MKFKLAESAPLTLTRTLITKNAKGLNVYEKETFKQDVVYDTADYEDKYPQFAQSVLDIKQQIANANNAQIAELREVHGDKLTVQRCSACGGRKANVLFPVFVEVK